MAGGVLGIKTPPPIILPGGVATPQTPPVPAPIIPGIWYTIVYQVYIIKVFRNRYWKESKLLMVIIVEQVNMVNI